MRIFLAFPIFWNKKGEPSYKSLVDNTFKKTLAISAASFFEEEVRRILTQMVSDRASADDLVLNFLKNKAITQQYHTYFNWKGANANQFLGLFGEAFLNSVAQDIKENPDLAEAIKVFIEIGRARNEIVHMNFASFVFDMTALEVYQKYQLGMKFVQYLEAKITAYGK